MLITSPAPGQIIEPTWYKDAVIYEIYIRSFFDSNDDGIGDLPGIIQKLDYLADLGVTAIWLLPFYPSPGRDGGYDIADYCSLDTNCGSMRDWKTFLRAAHSRGLKVITELVVNHTSDQHEWFQRSRRASAGSRWRDFYVWSDHNEKYKDARIIFKDFEVSNWTWDSVAGAFYWHRFYSHQPDLNFENPEVHKAIFRVLDFWFDQGVDGFRLDAIPYLYEREHTSCENLPETHAFIKSLRKHVDSKYKNRLLLAEANQWPEVAAEYFGQGEGDECHMAFHFPLMPRLFMGVRMEDKTPIMDILEQMPPMPPLAQWALFLRNHDELTLEMVTDEERDYMYGVYAQDQKARLNLGIRRRLAPLLGNDRRKIELLNILLLSMPGTPVLYYGDEIGMGDNIYLADRNGVRTPMQWNSDKNAGFSKANPQSLPLPVIVDAEYHYEAVNVATQDRNPNSLLWWTKRLLSLRKKWKAFGRGALEFVPTNNPKVLAFLRRYEKECVLVVANLSRLPQPLELKFTGMEDQHVTELFGHTEFPPIVSPYYPMTMSPHSAFWFSLTPARERLAVEKEIAPRMDLFVEDSWREILEGNLTQKFEAALGRFLQLQSWFVGKGRSVERYVIRGVLELNAVDQGACLVLLRLEYFYGDPEQYLLPLAFSPVEDSLPIAPDLIIADVTTVSGRKGMVYDAVGNPKLVDPLAAAMLGRRMPRGGTGVCRAWKSQAQSSVVAGALDSAKRFFVNRSNSTLIMEGQVYLKLYRRLEEGRNPEIETARLLAEKQFPNVPELLGTLEYRERSGKAISLAVMNRAVPHGKDSWRYAIEVLGRYFDRVQVIPETEAAAAWRYKPLLQAVREEIPTSAMEIVGTSFELTRLLGRRTAELHQALVDSEKIEYAPEPFTPFYLRSLYQSMRNRLMEAMDLIKTHMTHLPAEHQEQARQLLERKEELLPLLKTLVQGTLRGTRIRCHGTYQLSEVLFTSKDFFIIDFEGNPARSIGERQIKRSPAHDLATMLRSFDRVVHEALQERVDSGIHAAESAQRIRPWAPFWSHWVGVVFLQSYFKTLGDESPLIVPREDFEQMLMCQIIDKTAIELIADARRRPQWSWLAIQALLSALDQDFVLQRR